MVWHVGEEAVVEMADARLGGVRERLVVLEPVDDLSLEPLEFEITNEIGNMNISTFDKKDGWTVRTADGSLEGATAQIWNAGKRRSSSRILSRAFSLLHSNRLEGLFDRVKMVVMRLPMYRSH